MNTNIEEAIKVINEKVLEAEPTEIKETSQISPIDVQLTLRENAESLKQSLSAVCAWEKDIKKKESEKNLLTQKEFRPPIRSQLTKKPEIVNLMATTTTNDNNSAINQNFEDYNSNAKEEANYCKELGNEALRAKSYDLALIHYTNAIGLYDKEPIFFNNRAACNLSMKRYQECIDDCNKSLLLQGTHTDISKSHYRMVLAYEALGNIEAAMKHSKHLLTIDSGKPVAMQLFDRINARYNELQNFVPAKADLRYASSSSNSTSDSSDNSSSLKSDTIKESNKCKSLGNEAFDSENYVLAVQFYTKAIELNGTNPIFFCNRAMAYFNLKNFRDCIKDCVTTIKMSKNVDKVVIKAYYRKILATEQIGDYEIALADCELVLKLYSKNVEMQQVYERIKKLKNNEAKDGELSHPKWSLFEKNCNTIEFTHKPPHMRSKVSAKQIKINAVDKPSIKLTKHIENINTNLDTITKFAKQIPDSAVEKMFSDDAITVVQKKIIKDIKVTDAKNSSKIEHKHGNTYDTNLPQNNDNQRTNSIEENLLANNCNEEDGINNNLEKHNEKSDASEKPPETENKINELEEKTKEDILVLPRNGPEFFAIWKELSEINKCKYLKLLGDHHRVNKVLGPNLSNRILSEILEILSVYFINNNFSVIEILIDITKNVEMNILPLFYSASDKQAIKLLLQYMKQRNDNLSDIEKLNESYLIPANCF